MSCYSAATSSRDSGMGSDLAAGDMSVDSDVEMDYAAEDLEWVNGTNGLG